MFYPLVLKTSNLIRMSLIAKGVRRVEFEDGEWIDFKNAFSVKEMREMAKMQKAVAEKDPDSDEAFDLSIDMLDRSIVDWNVIDEHGEKIPYTKDALYLLDMRKLKVLLEESLRITGVQETEKELKKE